MVVFCGDVHGKYEQLKRLVKVHPNMIQLGDLGVGFIRTSNETPYPNPPHALLKETGFRAIRGNHDNPSVFKAQSYAIRDGHTELSPKGLKMMFMGGALSIDRHLRTERYDWWADEELNQSELYDMVDKYEEYKPDIMVTHDCPEMVASYMKNGMKMDFPSITRQALDSMFWIHKPKVHLFGHWHQSYDQVIDGTRFICLNELEIINLDI